MVTFIEGTNQKPGATQRLLMQLRDVAGIEGELYVGYPLIASSDGPIKIDAALVSRKHGLVLFDLVDGNEIGDYKARQDEIYVKTRARLYGDSTLTRGRSLRVTINAVTYAPLLNDIALRALDQEEGYPVTNEANLETVLNGLTNEYEDSYDELLSSIQAVRTIRKSENRRVTAEPGSRAARLRELENAIATLDPVQSRAVIETFDGVQRIRGLAGSGKTIILALKAAYLHAMNPDWRIIVTFHTRSLKDLFRRLIYNFYITRTGEEPNWNNLEILHAWGASGKNGRAGVYYKFCQLHDIPFHTFTSAQNSFGRGKEFEGACEAALLAAPEPKERLDAVLIDEAQDLPSAFMQICHSLLRDPKRLVYAYDELQNLREQSVPAPEVLFGSKPDGAPMVRFSTDPEVRRRQDITLEVCYRNSRPVLVTAHALGFGIYREPTDRLPINLVQVFEEKSLWSDVGYTVLDGTLEDGHHVTLGRSQRTSPRFLEDHSEPSDLIQFHSFNSTEQQASWVANEIRRNLEEDGLSHDDIIVINTDPIKTRIESGIVRARLSHFGIESHVAGVDTDPDVFFDTSGKSIAFTGIFRAKGNEAGMVYVINSQDCFDSTHNLATIRNRLFTAITRSKSWVRVVGVGEKMRGLAAEFERVRENDFTLAFRYPTLEERTLINVVNRDKTPDTEDLVSTHKAELARLLADLEGGKLYLEDLGFEQIERLRRHFQEGDREIDS